MAEQVALIVIDLQLFQMHVPVPDFPPTVETLTPGRFK
jgi:hypothetical protein